MRHRRSLPRAPCAPTFPARASTLRPIEDEVPDLISTEDPDLSDRSGFLRVGAPPKLEGVPEGPRWSREEADAHAHLFLGGGGCPPHPPRHEDPIEHARENALLLLFGETEMEAFETLLARMPRDRAEEWRELFSGGASSEAFGPLTLQERLDEKQVEYALVQGRRQRVINLALGAVAIFALIVGGVAGFRSLTSDDQRTEGALRFDPVTEATRGDVSGGPPVVAPELATSLSTIVAVAPGEGTAEERIVTAPFSALPQPPGALRAALFEYGGEGQIAVVGPAGWLSEPVCLRASVVSADLRALDTVTWQSADGACAQSIGRIAEPVCVGDSAVLLDLRIPVGEVELPEGGVAFADAIRVQLVAPPTDQFELLTVRGLIAVAAGSDVTIPGFGGGPGDELTFDLGADRSGTCTIGGPDAGA